LCENSEAVTLMLCTRSCDRQASLLANRQNTVMLNLGNLKSYPGINTCLHLTPWSFLISFVTFNFSSSLLIEMWETHKKLLIDYYGFWLCYTEKTAT